MRRLILAATLALALPAHAEFFTGNQLPQAGDSGKATDFGGCIGCVTGGADTLNTAAFCPPARITRGQVRDLVVKYLRDRPEDRNYTADRIIRHVLQGTWPCQQTDQPAANRPSH